MPGPMTANVCRSLETQLRSPSAMLGTLLGSNAVRSTMTASGASAADTSGKSSASSSAAAAVSESF
eukprot:CAMPEP_0204049312 /NCGR_PEP_ID=MMETSP0360-20130528/117996_1 /ASSEMBLY_ACC=CAM_ASM_000342 /TAXON_ID=268821 /ORGANISM="Scrippsiella Hangoei, Strain SHTV-5" /LENGTH=65 /DNA_ID=CAMNT_0050996185 /DNA_START=31 /DNA_END=225 /DNA_ORIENTATION=-